MHVLGLIVAWPLTNRVEEFAGRALGCPGKYTTSQWRCVKKQTARFDSYNKPTADFSEHDGSIDKPRRPDSKNRRPLMF